MRKGYQADIIANSTYEVLHGKMEKLRGECYTKVVAMLDNRGLSFSDDETFYDSSHNEVVAVDSQNIYISSDLEGIDYPLKEATLPDLLQILHILESHEKVVEITETETSAILTLKSKTKLDKIRETQCDDRVRLYEVLDKSGYLGTEYKFEGNLGLTEIPAFSNSNGDLFYYNHYMRHCFTDRLLREGKVEFTKHR